MSFPNTQKLKKALKEFSTNGLPNYEELDILGDKVFVKGIKEPIPDCLYYIRTFNKKEFSAFLDFWKVYHTIEPDKSEVFLQVMLQSVRWYKNFDKNKLIKDLNKLKEKPTTYNRLKYYTKYPREVDYTKFLTVNIDDFYNNELEGLKNQDFDIELTACELPEYIKVFTEGLDVKQTFCFDNNLETNLETKILIHGTSNVSVLSIIKNGLKIRPDTEHKFSGKAYGEGLYFTETTQKALQYCSSKDKVIMFFEVAVGNPYVYKGRYKDDIKFSEEWMKSNGYDSLVVPKGGSKVNDETIVYNENQAVLKYLIWI